MDPFYLTPIGYFYSKKTQTLHAARQASAAYSKGNDFIKLLPNQNFEQALTSLSTFSHIWVIYGFHLHSTWKAQVLPPRGSQKKLGVFASRSPYRPNPIGLSALQVDKVDGLKIFVQKNDLLDQTPIFDIKPYLKFEDSIPEANLGWLEGIDKQEFKIEFSKNFLQQLTLLPIDMQNLIKDFSQQQLQFDPLDKRKKRVQISAQDQAILSYRTWRLLFSFDQHKNIVIESLSSAYTEEDLANLEDPYFDKILHRKFIQVFPAQKPNEY